MSVDGISALERGHRRSPQRETLALLAGALALNGEERQKFEAAGVRSGRVRVAGAEPATRGSARGLLPLAFSSFIGRKAELAEIAELVREHRMVTLTGAGGIGKTQTALRVGSAFSDGGNAVCFVELAPLGDPSLIVASVASALGVEGVPNHPLLETVCVYLKNKSLLLILDNCEHLISAAASVAEKLLSAGPGVRILATSRESLRVGGEHAYRLPSLGTPDAITLFAVRARAVDHRFRITEQSTPPVTDICQRLNHIPLAIELAAARVNALSTSAIAAKLHDHFGILSGGDRTALPRQQTMRASIEWSYDLLSAPERQLFERFSVFAGGFTLAAAEAVCADESLEKDGVMDLLLSLVDKSLVVADFEAPECRYWLLESFRQYAREKLAVHGESEVVAHRHALAYLELAQQLELMHDTELNESWRSLIKLDLDNWRAALQWALIKRGDVALGLRLVCELRVVWEYSATVEGRRWLTSALELIDERTPMDVLAGLKFVEAVVAKQLREHQAQLLSSQSAVEAYQRAGDSLGAVRAKSLTGHAFMMHGRLTEAKTALQDSLTSAREFDRPVLVAFILRCLGYTSNAAGDIVAGRAYIVEAQAIYEAQHDDVSVALASIDLSLGEFQAGNAEVALGYAMSSLATLRKRNAMHLIALALSNVAGFLIALTRYDEAEPFVREALDLACALHLNAVAAWSLQHSAAIAVLRPHVAPCEADPSGRAARILGFVDARLAAMGSLRDHLEQQEYDRVLSRLRDTDGAETIANLMANGKTMTEEQAIDEASAFNRLS